MPTKQLPCTWPSFYSNGGVFTAFNQVFPGYRIGDAVRGWRSAIKSGANASSNMTFDRYFVDDSRPLSVKIDYGYFTSPGNRIVKYAPLVYAGYHYGKSVADFGHIGSISSSAEAKALSKLYDRIRSETEAVNGLLILGELRETIRMLRNPCQALFTGTKKYLDALKSNRIIVNRRVRLRSRESEASLDRRRRQALVNAMAGSWLEYRFGVLPLLDDVKGVTDAIVRHLTQPSLRKRVRSNAYTDYASNNSTSQIYGYGWVDQTHLKTTKAGAKYIVGLEHSSVGPTDQAVGLKNLLGFNWRNFVPTVWELIPYSFLIDYFVNVGDILNAACTDTSGFRWGCKVSYQDTVSVSLENYRIKDNGYPAVWWESIVGDNLSSRTLRHISVQRARIESIPLPSVVVSLPGETSLQWVNMAALLASAKDFRFRS